MTIFTVEGLTKHFSGLKAVQEVSFKAKSGSIIGLIGPNGAGKTTTFNLITGFLQVTSGKVIFDGNDITNLKPHQICSLGLTRTFQHAQPFASLSVFDNVLAGAYLRGNSYKEAKKITESILKRVGMFDRKERLTKDLTIGETKKLEIARALATKPKVVLLDEVMAGLTSVEVDEIIALIQEQRTKNGITFILIEHVMRAVMELSDYVVVLQYGHKIAEGTPSEVTTDKKVIEAYLGEDELNA